MKGKTKSAAVTLMLVCVVLGFNWACSKGSATRVEPNSAPKTIELDRYQVAFDVKAKAYAKIPRIKVRRGKTVVYSAATGTAFFLFPHADLATVVDGKDTPASGGFIAFMVGDEREVVFKVPLDFPDPGIDVAIPYSVLACTGKGVDMKCEYVHGESPPRIIIPTR